MSYLFGSKFSRYQSIAELEEVKYTIKKVIEFLRTATYEETTWLGYPSNYDGINILERKIKEIDKEIDKRKHPPSPFGGSILSSYVDRYGITYQFVKQIDTSQSSLYKESLNEKKIKELRKDNENLTKELEHEQTHSSKSDRVIEWLTGLRGSFYKSDVEEDE